LIWRQNHVAYSRVLVAKFARPPTPAKFPAEDVDPGSEARVLTEVSRCLELGFGWEEKDREVRCEVGRAQARQHQACTAA
jgi:hypothetical protein